MYNLTHQQMKFIAEYLPMYAPMFHDQQNVERVKKWWKVQRKSEAVFKKTTGVDLTVWDYEILDSIPFEKGYIENQSQKIRYLLRLGAMAHYMSFGFHDFIKTVELMEQMKFSTDDK